MEVYGMYIVNQAGEKAKYKKEIDTLTIYATKVFWEYCEEYTLRLWIVRGVSCYLGYISDLDKQAYFFNYTPTERQRKLITAFCRNVAKKERVKL